ncbi:hypothetical protein RvY_16214 [Ramazzottius varieornatus]|uniref:WW domain binding protein VOPP1 n=1 Tax=Ramazzottius varieornatus TaxID=947166 RepID=A0A1D1W237_RAMVA|nr:hypothetical protein RvY_16214 [Ramazzottius varieornatus]
MQKLMYANADLSPLSQFHSLSDDSIQTSNNHTLLTFLCTARFGSKGTVSYLCLWNETCCNDTCCPQVDVFYNLWYFWFTLIFLTVFISGSCYTCYQQCRLLREQEVWASSQLAAMRLMRIMDTLASGSRPDVDHMDNEESIKRYLTSFNVGTGRSSIAEELPNQAFLDMPDPDYMPPSLFFHAPANFLPEETIAPSNTEVVSTSCQDFDYMLVTSV